MAWNLIRMELRPCESSRLWGRNKIELFHLRLNLTQNQGWLHRHVNSAVAWGLPA